LARHRQRKPLTPAAFRTEGALAESAPAAAGWDSGVPPRQEPETPVASPAQSHRHFTEPTAAAKKNARSSPLIVRACPVTVNPAPARISPELTRQSPCWRLPGGMRSPLTSTRASYAVLVAGAQLLLRP